MVPFSLKESVLSLGATIFEMEDEKIKAYIKGDISSRDDKIML